MATAIAMAIARIVVVARSVAYTNWWSARLRRRRRFGSVPCSGPARNAVMVLAATVPPHRLLRCRPRALRRLPAEPMRLAAAAQDDRRRAARRLWQPIAACKGSNAIDYFPYWKMRPPALVACGRWLFCASRPRCLAFWNETDAAADKGLRLTRLHNNPCVPYTYANMDRAPAVCAGCPTQLETRIPPTFWGN